MPEYQLINAKGPHGRRRTKSRVFNTKKAAEKAYKSCKGPTTLAVHFKTKRGRTLKTKGFR